MIDHFTEGDKGPELTDAKKLRQLTLAYNLAHKEIDRLKAEVYALKNQISYYKSCNEDAIAERRKMSNSRWWDFLKSMM